MTVQILHGDCRDVLRTLADESVHCCVTSPPYWGLRSYLPDGHPMKAREIGSEPTVHDWVATMVEVFREVRRVLRPDGTLWLNLGDSYATRWSSARREGRAGLADNERERHGPPPDGFKNKDLIGQPWRVAFALQQPYYAGRIKDERDRVWLAAMIDAEGCLFIHKRKAGTDSHARFTKADGTTVSYERKQDTYGVGLEISNTSLGVVERVQQIVGAGTITSQSPDQNSRRRQTIYRWRVQPNECKRIVQEVYPHLVAKQHQARLLLGCPSGGERADAAHQALMGLHKGSPTDVDFPAPASLFEPGFYLRQELIWGKKNPMPESVTDRFTKAHEQVFLLSKGERYYFDLESVKEPASEGTHARRSYKTPDGWDTSTGDGGHGGFHKAGREKGRVLDQGVGRIGGHPDNPPEGARRKLAEAPIVSQERKALRSDVESRHRSAVPGGQDLRANPTSTRNPRTVRWLASEPFRGAHYATYPAELIRPFVLAGCPEGGVVLDPFGGSGTTGLVADQHGRSAILIDIDERNLPMARERIAGDAPLFAEVA